MATVTIAIPSRTERFLQRTILDVLENATGDVEILPVLDGYDPPAEEIVHDSRVRYIRLPQSKHTQKRHGMNEAVRQASGKYVMSVDAHCMFAKGFDEVLVRDHQDHWVQVMRRNRLDAENWSLQSQVDTRPPIDYEYIMFPQLIRDKALHGFKWDHRTLTRWDTLVDDVLTFQGSAWFMTKEWYQSNGLMQIEGYTGWGQEAEEMSFTTWSHGGECKVNKNTWYAHLHKGAKYGRMYWMSREEGRRSYAYAYQHWVVENRAFFQSMIERFMPMPNWPENWRQQLWGH